MKRLKGETVMADMSRYEQAYNGHYFVPYTKYDEYSEIFKPFFSMKREDGIIEVRMHKENEPGKPAMWSWAHHKGWGQLFKLIGQDPENEVLIISGDGDKWVDIETSTIEASDDLRTADPGGFLDTLYPQYRDGSDLVNNTVFDLHIPTIGIINGPGPGHTEVPLFMDLTLMTPDSIIQDPHFMGGFVPGDGQHLANHYFMGHKRAVYLSYTGGAISAQTALDWGVVNEVLPRPGIWDRAWEIARLIMKQPRHIRRLAHDMMREPLRRYISDFFQGQFPMEWWGCCYLLDPKTHHGWQDMVDITEVNREKVK